MSNGTRSSHMKDIAIIAISVEQEGQKFRLVWKDYINLKHAPQHIARVVGTFLLYHFHWLCKSILYIIFIIIQAYLLSKLFK